MSEIEKQAAAMGWVPKEDFKGDEDKWIPAEEFVERGTNIMPILQENLKRLTKKIDGLQTERKTDMETFKRFQEFATKSEERAFKKAESEYKTKLADLKRDLKKAAKEEDWETFDRIESNIDTLEKPEAPEKIEVKKPSPNEDPVFIEWKEANSWYGEDIDKTIYADQIAGYVKNKNKSLTGKAFFDEVARIVKEKFPDDNGNRKQRVETGNLDISESKKKTFADIPEEDKKAYFDDKKIMPDFKKEDYAKMYWGE